jgi:hypothetical protein
MELALNLIWLLLALAAIALWRLRWTNQPRARRQAPWREWTSVACALVLLFFVVSLTDDLHANVLALEDSSISRRQVNCLSPAHHQPQPKHFPTTPGVAILPAALIGADFAAGLVFAATSTPQQLCQRQETHSGRAPPVAI